MILQYWQIKCDRNAEWAPVKIITRWCVKRSQTEEFPSESQRWIGVVDKCQLADNNELGKEGRAQGKDRRRWYGGASQSSQRKWNSLEEIIGEFPRGEMISQVDSPLGNSLLPFSRLTGKSLSKQGIRSTVTSWFFCPPYWRPEMLLMDLFIAPNSLIRQIINRHTYHTRQRLCSTMRQHLYQLLCSDWTATPSYFTTFAPYHAWCPWASSRTWGGPLPFISWYRTPCFGSMLYGLEGVSMVVFLVAKATTPPLFLSFSCCLYIELK